ncbi:MAG: hypothetical protein ABJG68_01550 [Crocinitomicaceae bacterium]
MKKLFSLLLIINTSIVFSQEFENEKVKIKYFKPALAHDPVTPSVNAYVTEPASATKAEAITYLASLNSDARSKFYFQKLNIFSKQIKPTDVIQDEGSKDTIAQLDIVLGDYIQGETTFYAEDIKKPDGTITGKKWIASMTRTLPMTYTYYDENGVKILDACKMEMQHTLKYPNNFFGKAPVYKTKKALLDVFLPKKEGIENLAKDQCFSKNLRQLSGIIKDAFSTRYSKIVVKLATLKLKKKEKPKYADALELETRMLANLEKVVANGKAENNKNWHSPEIQQEFAALKEAYIQMLGADVELEKNGGTPRFNNTTFVALTKNMLWCMFFINEHAEVLKQATALEKGDDSSVDNTSLSGITNDFKISWWQLKAISSYYAPVYLKNKERYGWE